MFGIFVSPVCVIVAGTRLVIASCPWLMDGCPLDPTAKPSPASCVGGEVSGIGAFCASAGSSEQFADLGMFGLERLDEGLLDRPSRSNPPLPSAAGSMTWQSPSSGESASVTSCPRLTGFGTSP